MRVLMLSGTDVSVDGSQWSAGASPSLAHLIRDVALKVPHPTDNTRTLWDARHDVGPFDGLMGSESTEALLQQTLNAQDRKSTRLNSSHSGESRMPSSA